MSANLKSLASNYLSTGGTALFISYFSFLNLFSLIYYFSTSEYDKTSLKIIIIIIINYNKFKEINIYQIGISFNTEFINILFHQSSFQLALGHGALSDESDGTIGTRSSFVSIFTPVDT